MALQNHHHLRDSINQQELIASFMEACSDYEGKKVREFDLKYSVSQRLRLVPHDVGRAALETLALPSTPSSSFRLLYRIITHLKEQCGHGGSDQQDLPQVWADFINMPVPPLATKELSRASLGSKSKESESSHGGHGDPTEDLNPAISYSNDYHVSIPISEISSDPYPSASPEIPNNQQVNPVMSPSIFNMPMSPSESSPPRSDDTKLGFTVFVVELLGALSNLAVSSRAEEYQALIYAVVTTFAFAFLLSATAIPLHKKRPNAAKIMQKAAFLCGAFGFLGILGMLLPASMMWWFTVSTFLACLLMLAIASYVS